ncbi:uncharacterized protein LOC113161990 isoform X2 [Anabas testudineus]|uniref:uncharacterized protein LOC113161990 isoform X2 n=1 Tax=Anabas testudineus TaxID=64144 RepID=UPI000E46370D|nr:uncharacterized protein LOC113161990 isoform X2 [Anabas testudineus]
MKLKAMDGEGGQLCGRSRKEMNRSYKCFLMDVEELEEPDEQSSRRPHQLFQEPISKMRQHSGNSESEAELCGAESLGIFPFYPGCVSQDSWGKRGEDEESQSSMLEYSVYLDEQHNMADCSLTSFVHFPATPVTHRPCLFTPVPNSVTTIASTMSSVVGPLGSSPTTDNFSPTVSAWDTLRSTSRQSWLL